MFLIVQSCGYLINALKRWLKVSSNELNSIMLISIGGACDAELKMHT